MPQAPPLFSSTTAYSASKSPLHENWNQINVAVPLRSRPHSMKGLGLCLRVASLEGASPAWASMDPSGRQWTREDVRRAINDRYLLVRELEKTGFRRLLFASVAFIGKHSIQLRVWTAKLDVAQAHASIRRLQVFQTARSGQGKFKAMTQ
jgi:hypothetical protein